MFDATLLTVDLVAGTSSCGSNLGIGRATKKIRTRKRLLLSC